METLLLHPYDILVLLAFLILTLAIGIVAGSSLRSFPDYALSGRRYTTGALVLTYLATDIGGGSVFGDTQEVFSQGIIMTAALSGLAVSFLLRAWLLAPRMHRFSDCLTLGDVMAKLYGPRARYIAGLLSLFSALSITALQLIAMGMATACLVGLPAQWGSTAAAVLLATYTAAGGIRAVTATDIFQFLILIVILPTLASLAVSHVGGLEALLQAVPPERWQLTAHPRASYYGTFFLLWAVFSVEMTDPAIMQRLLMAREGRQLRQQQLIVAGADFSFRLVILLLGLSACVLFPTMAASEVLPTLVQTLLPVGLKGLAVAGLFAVILSTADSQLHAASLAVAHDLAVPLRITRPMLWARCSTLLLSAGALLISQQGGSLLGWSLVARTITGPLLAFPLVLGILGLKPHPLAFTVSMSAAGVTFAATYGLLPAHSLHLAPLLAILSSGLTFLSSHLLLHKGLAFAKDDQGSTTWWQGAHLLQRDAPAGPPYDLFAVCSCLHFLLPHFMWSQPAADHATLLLALRLVGATLCALLLTRTRWPLALKPVVPAFWHLTLAYCLAMMPTVMLLATQGSTEWMLALALSLALLLLLLEWRAFIAITMAGIGAGIGFAKACLPTATLSGTDSYLLAYQALLTLLVGCLFARRRQQQHSTLSIASRQEATQHKQALQALISASQERAAFIKALRVSSKRNLAQLLEVSQALVKQGAAPHALQAHLTVLALQLSRLDHHTSSYMRLEATQKPLKSFLQQVRVALQAQGLERKLTIELKAGEQHWQADMEQMQTVMLQGVSLLRLSVGAQKPLLLCIEQARLGYTRQIQGYRKEFAALRFTLTSGKAVPEMPRCYGAQGYACYEQEEPTGAQQLLLAASERIVRAHYGHADVIASKGIVTLVYVLPVKLREVRAAALDDPEQRMGAVWMRADDLYPGAQEQEADFMEAVTFGNRRIDTEQLKGALELIKWYHGARYHPVGEPFYLHAVGVGRVVVELNSDQETILAALLHNMAEQTPEVVPHLGTLFGKQTQALLECMVQLSAACTERRAIHEHLLALQQGSDHRALMIKLADRVHELRRIHARPLETQWPIAEEILRFYVPLARQLRLYDLAAELNTHATVVMGKRRKPRKVKLQDRVVQEMSPWWYLLKGSDLQNRH